MFKHHASRVGLVGISALAAAFALVATAAPASSAPPGGGGGHGGGGSTSGPTGRLYFIDSASGQNTNYTWSVNPDGSGATKFGFWGYFGIPSQTQHASHTYFLTNRTIPGAYLSDGTTPQWEVFAVRDDYNAANNDTSETKVQLTADAGVQPMFPGFGGACWFRGDGMISFRAKDGWDGSSFTTGGIYTAEVSFDSSGAVTGLVAPATRVLECSLDSYGSPTLGSHCWNSGGTQVAYTDSAAAGLWVADLSAGTQTRIYSSAANFPSWSPDGAKIVFNSGSSCCTIKPDGKGFREVIKAGYVDSIYWRAFSHPVFSPDSAYIHCTGYPNQGWTDLFVASATGGGLQNITNTTDIGEASIAWCEE